MISNRAVSLVTSFILGLLFIFGIAACEEDLDTLAPIDGIFAINGYLDATADTQWVRVTPFRSTILSTPDPVDAVVTLEHLGTGRIVEMNSSLFVFPNPNFGGDAYGHNFWTDDPIERGASYRLTARRSDGESATAVVKIPRGLTESVVRVGAEYSSQSNNGQSYQVVHLRFDIPPGDHLAFLSFEHYRKFPHSCSPRPIETDLYPILGERPAGPVTFEHPLRRNLGTPNLGFPCFVQPYIRWTASVILSGERWPNSPGDYVGYLDQGSNIENGMGYLGGVVSEKIPVPRCALRGPGAPQICELFFGREAVTLDVLVRDPEGRLMPNNPAPLGIEITKAGESWSRSADLLSVYPVNLDYVPDLPLTIARFPGLLPGEYRITVPEFEQTGFPGITTYCEERTVVLSAAEHRSVEIETIVMSHLPEPVNASGCREG